MISFLSESGNNLFVNNGFLIQKIIVFLHLYVIRPIRFKSRSQLRLFVILRKVVLHSIGKLLLYL